MIKQNEINVSANDEQTIFGLSIPLKYEEEDLIGSLEKINFTYIKYVGKKKFIENDICVEKFFIEFIDMPIEIIKELANIINLQINEFNKKQTVYEILKSIVNLFSDHKLEKKLKKEFFSDLIMSIFIFNYKEKFNFDLSKHIITIDGQSNFLVNQLNKYIFLKPFKANANTIAVTWEESEKMFEINDFDFYVIELKLLNNQTSIIEIYEMIGLESDYIKGKHKFWKTFLLHDEFKSIILQKNTIDLNDINIFKIDSNLFPRINVENPTYVDQIEIKLAIEKLKLDSTPSLKIINDNLINKSH